jgi:hypothetical protein
VIIYVRTKIENHQRIRDRSLFIVQGGIEEELGGPLNFLNLKGGGFEKIQRDERRGL